MRDKRKPNRLSARQIADLLRVPLRAVSRQVALRSPSRTIVLLYHSIGDAKDAVTAADFAEQMAYLREKAVIVSLDQIVQREHFRIERPLKCAITFDDGYQGVFEFAYPILKKYRFPALLYITTDAMGDSEAKASDQYPGLFSGDLTLTWRQIREMSANHVTIGSHLCQHKDLTLLSESEGLSELCRSRSFISRKLRIDCRHFAHPFGRFNRQTVQWVRTAGYQTCTTVVHSPVGRHFDPLRIPRMCVAPIHTMNDFKAMLRGDYDYLPLVHLARRLLNLSYPAPSEAGL
jgi:peptidoglycan/xylan/chitin deacetylase (PgdA/CDA1 family)